MPVGVFVNAAPAYIQACVDCGAIEAVQFHGQESPADCAAIHGAKKIKVFVTGEDQPAPPGSYPVNYLLFDSGRGDGIAPKDRQIPLVTDRFSWPGAKHRKYGRNHCRLFSLRRRS